MAIGFKKGISGEAYNVDKGPKTPASTGGPKTGRTDVGSKGLEKGKVSKEGGGQGGGGGVEGAHNFDFATGGDTPMFGHQNADTQKGSGGVGSHTHGETAHDNGPAQSQGTGAAFAKGGSQGMFGYAPSQPATAGITSAR